jgi:hypothetical protein
MGLTRCFDASTQIPDKMPPGCKAVLGYIGGQARHVWTTAEWNRFGHGKDVRLFPCWVADFAADPRQSARHALDAARKLGWRPHRVVVLDTEVAVDRRWVREFTHEVEGELTVVNYGSAAFVARNGSTHLWVAKWDDDPVLEGGQSVDGHQYVADVQVAGGVVDFSVINEWLFDHGGRGPRR